MFVSYVIGSPPPRSPAPRDAAAASPAQAREPWYRSPILWLGAAMLGASIAGCIVTVLLALGHADTPLPVEGDELLNVPAAPAVEPALPDTRSRW